MKIRRVAICSLASSAFAAASASAAIVELTATATGTDQYIEYTGDTLRLTLEFADGTQAIQPSKLSWNLSLWRNGSKVDGWAGGGDLGTAFEWFDNDGGIAMIAFNMPENFTSSLSPEPASLTFSYGFSGSTSQTLLQAIEASQTSSSFLISIAAAGMSTLEGSYVVVPAPGAATLIAVAAGLAGRRRRG